MKSKKGNFIVIEGIDGSGKATQCNLLFKKLLQKKIKVKKIDFPKYYDNFFGRLIGECLAGKHGDFLKIDPYIVSVLYGADRFESKKTIQNWLKKGYIVISDRYVSSNQIHQGAKIQTPKEKQKLLKWIEKMEYSLFKVPKPDLTIFLDVSVEVSQNLLKNKSKAKKKYLKGKKDLAESNKKHLLDARKSALTIIENSSDWKKINCVKNNKILPKKIISNKIYNIIEKKLLNL
ncbi:MAG: dTMP kinase [Candidatus Moranbacteria bacterium]|nr:dTMP kinase [Candidatus Moranbacteria bacterium]